MDNKVVGDTMFQVLKRMIITENKALFKIISKEHNISYSELEEKYLKPEYYLPLVVKDGKHPNN